MTALLKVNLLPNLRVTPVPRLFNSCSSYVHSRQIQSAPDKPRITQPVIYRFRKITSPSNASSIPQAELDHCTSPTHAFAMRSHCVRSDVTSDFTSDFRRTSMGGWANLWGIGAWTPRSLPRRQKIPYFKKIQQMAGVKGKSGGPRKNAGGARGSEGVR